MANYGIFLPNRDFISHLIMEFGNLIVLSPFLSVGSTSHNLV